MSNIIDRTFNINLNQSYKRPNPPKYKLNDLSSVYTHYDAKLGINIATKNKLKEDINNGNENN